MINHCSEQSEVLCVTSSWILQHASVGQQCWIEELNLYGGYEARRRVLSWGKKNTWLLQNSETPEITAPEKRSSQKA